MKAFKKEAFADFEDVREDFKHPNIFYKSGKPMELDVYVPRLKLAFEYQAMQFQRLVN